MDPAGRRDLIAIGIAVVGTAIAIWSLSLVGGLNPPAIGLYLAVAAVVIMFVGRTAGRGRWTALSWVVSVVSLLTGLGVTALAVAFCGIGTLWLQRCIG